MITKPIMCGGQFTAEIFNDNDYYLDKGDVVVIRNLVAIAAEDIPMQRRGIVYTCGTFVVPKAENCEVNVGDELYWCSLSLEVTTDEEYQYGGATYPGIYLGIAADYAHADDEDVRVLLNYPRN